MTRNGNFRIAKSPEEALRLSEQMNREARRLDPKPRPRGFVLKFKTWEEREQWKQSQSRSRL